MPALFGTRPSGAEVGLITPRISSVHVRPNEAMREYALMVLKFRAIYSAVFENRMVRYFLRAVPSLSEIVMLGKVCWHALQDDRFDLVVLDAPATGHALSLLSTPSTILELVNEGPLARDMRAMQALLEDARRSAVSLVALPEEMPVNEAVDLAAQLRKVVRMARGPDFLNAFFPSRFSEAAISSLKKDQDPNLEIAARAARAYEDRAALSAFYLEKMRTELGRPPICVPHLFSESFGALQVAQLAEVLDREIPA